MSVPGRNTMKQNYIRSSLLTSNLCGVYHSVLSQKKVYQNWLHSGHYLQKTVYVTTLSEDLLSWEFKGPTPPMPRFAPGNNQALQKDY